jgi:hypothetical protein
VEGVSRRHLGTSDQPHGLEAGDGAAGGIGPRKNQCTLLIQGAALGVRSASGTSNATLKWRRSSRVVSGVSSDIRSPG